MACILVVEDSPAQTLLAKKALETAGHTVLSAKDGVSAIACARHDHPDLILMDLCMPLMDGFEATKTLKADPRTKDIPVIAISVDMPSLRKNALSEIGCFDFLSKPYDIHDLVAHVERALP